MVMGSLDGCGEVGHMVMIGSSETEIDNVDPLLQTPIDGIENNGERGRETGFKDLDGEDISVRSHLLEKRTDGGAVTQIILKTVSLAFGCNGDAAGDGAPDMRMIDEDSAIKNGNMKAPRHTKDT
jgi:hypothetical protein